MSNQYTDIKFLIIKKIVQKRFNGHTNPHQIHFEFHKWFFIDKRKKTQKVLALKFNLFEYFPEFHTIKLFI